MSSTLVPLFGVLTGVRSMLMTDLVRTFVHRGECGRLKPFQTGRTFRQYLAVAPFPSGSHSPEIGVKVLRPSYACIQIWSLRPCDPSSAHIYPTTGTNQSLGEMKCEMVICVDGGPAHELKWCPLPSHDLVCSSPFSCLRLTLTSIDLDL